MQTIVETMEARHGAVGKVWIMDRGMASADNVAWLRQTGRRYILGAPKSELRPRAPALAEKAQWREIRDGIEVKLCAAPDRGAETLEAVSQAIRTACSARSAPPRGRPRPSWGN